MNQSRGSFSFFLHGHLPWVLPHGRWPHGAEWVCEATIATYLPLVQVMRRLRDRGVSGGVTLGISPVLAEQLADPEFHSLLRDYVDERTRTSSEEAEQFAAAGDTQRADLARGWEEHYAETGDLFFGELDRDLIGALRDLQNTGTLELATCGATHGYLPLLGRDESISLQVELACAAHERHFGRRPRGIWLPEAAYRPGGPWRSNVRGDAPFRPGVEEFLSRSGIEYFVIDSALLLGGRGAGSYPQHFGAVREGTTRTGSSGPMDTRLPHWVARDQDSPDVAFFTRDPGTGLQVWSGEHGYPGDPAYLEFHKKSEGGGHRYWKVTGGSVDLGNKEVYDPGEARTRVGWQADHFRDLVAESLSFAPAGGVITAPYDAELFGHWWFEGVHWLERVLDGFHKDPRVELTTLGRHLDRFEPCDVVRLPEGSWGRGGRHEVWMNPEVEWSWRLIYPLEDQVWELWSRAHDLDGADLRRVVTAAVRQLLLLSASDWQFLITTGTAADYATNRLRRHADDLACLTDLGRRLLAGKSPGDDDRRLIEELEQRDPLFPELAQVTRRLRELAAPITP